MMIGERISDRLNATGMSQAELARRVKVDQSTINGLIKGTAKSSRHLHRIARELGTTAAYLAGETSDSSASDYDQQLTSEEREWLELLRALPTADRRATMRLLRLAASGARLVNKSSEHAHEIVG